VFRRTLLASIAALGAATTCAYAQSPSNNLAASERAAHAWPALATTDAPQVPRAAALSPTGPTLIASLPVPDTPNDRVLYGEPLSRAGKLTPAIGD
jgi:hypothetical protein